MDKDNTSKLLKSENKETKEVKGKILIRYDDGFISFQNPKAIVKDDPKCNTTEGHYGRSALHLACTLRRPDLIEHLIKYVHIDTTDANNETTLHYACKFGFEDVVCKLLSLGCNVNIKCSKGLTPLHVASANGFYTIVNLLLKFHADVNMVDENDYNPLMLASVKGHSEIIKLLIHYGSHVNRKLKRSTPLYFAIKHQDIEVVELLISKNANVNHSDWSGLTPLMLACSGSIEIVKVLINAGSIVTHQNIFGKTALHSACKAGNIEITKLLLMENSDTNAENYRGLSILRLILICHHVSNRKLDLMLNYGLKMNVKNMYKLTALHAACIIPESRHKINLLLNYDIDINISDAAGELPVFYVRRYNHDSFRYFKEHIVKLNVAGFPVHESNLMEVDPSEFVEFRKNCERDVESMKKSILSGSITYYDILKTNHSHEFISLAKCALIVNKLQISRYKTKFPCYRNLLKVKIEKILHVSRLLKYADKILLHFFGRYLPYEILLLVRDCYSLRDLQTFYDRVWQS